MKHYSHEKYNLTVDDLKKKIFYDWFTGIFITLDDGKIPSYHKDGYLSIGLNNFRYKAHLLAWLYMTGEFPPKDRIVDHRDRNRSNNKWSNLRLATPSQNQSNKTLQRNSTTGYKGVSWDKSRHKWISYIVLSGKNKYLGRFDLIEEAALAYNEAALKYFGEFANLNEVDV